MPHHDTPAQLLLQNEVFHVIGHHRIVVLTSMEGLAMVPEILEPRQ